MAREEEAEASAPLLSEHNAVVVADADDDAVSKSGSEMGYQSAHESLDGSVVGGMPAGTIDDADMTSGTGMFAYVVLVTQVLVFIFYGESRGGKGARPCATRAHHRPALVRTSPPPPPPPPPLEHTARELECLGPTTTPSPLFHPPAPSHSPIPPLPRSYNYVVGITLMMTVGFGYLRTFLRYYGMGAVGLTLFILALGIEVSPWLAGGVCVWGGGGQRGGGGSRCSLSSHPRPGPCPASRCVGDSPVTSPLKTPPLTSTPTVPRP